MLAAVLIACPLGAPAIAAPEKAVKVEKNPPGDIPDDQIFVAYNSPLGFTLKVPEGWSRADRPDGVRFFDKYNIIDISIVQSRHGSDRELGAVARGLSSQPAVAP
jgi:hypothetical protein